MIPTLIIIYGPTAVGKTSLTIRLAKAFATEIISCDSRQFFKELNIGVARPSVDDLKSINHHFVGHISAQQHYNAGDFEKDAITLLGNLFQKYKVVFMTGGSGLYIDAITNGFDVLPERNQELRTKLESELNIFGIKYLQEKLRKLDPDYFDIVDPNNPQRLIRALEVIELSGKKYSDLRSNEKVTRNFRIIKIRLEQNREILYQSINTRVDQMMELGLLNEVKGLYPIRHLNALKTVGYRELYEYLDGNITLDKAIYLIKQNTRHYAKRQITWFRRYQDDMIFNPENENEIFTYIENQLKQHG